MATLPAMSHSKMEISDSAEKTKSYTNETEELRAALSEALRREDELRSQLSLHSPDDTVDTATCVFFEKLPLELRERIYKCLLVNPDLLAARYLKAWRQQAVQDKDRGTPYKFGLSPQILRVCSQAHNEAKLILYHHNIFVIEFVTKDVGYALRSPVFRFPNKEAAQQHRPSKSKFLQECYPWVTNVKHWKIILTTNLEDKSHAPDDSFTYFCRHLCFNKPRSLEVLLLPKGDAFKGPRWTSFAPRGFHHPKEVLQPLTMLRNIASLKIGEVERSDLPVRVDPSQSLVSISNNIPQELKVSLKTLVEGDTPIKYVFMMYEKLLEYAQAFERHPRFKAEMSPVWGLARRNRTQRERLVYSREHNPFKQDPFHPVEMNLELASIASEANDADAFKQARSAVLEYLEPQYQRIVAQAAAMAEFVKDENRRRGRGWPSLFQGSDYPPERDFVTTCIMYLEDYAATFVRDVPSYTKFHIRKEKEEFDFAYSTLEREMTMAMLYNIQALRSMVYATREWRKWFKSAVDDMDKQYLAIRKARKALLDFDADDNYGCDIDLELWRCDEMINWGATEPNLHPLHLPTPDELHEYFDDSDDFDDCDDFGDGDDGDDVETGETGEAGDAGEAGDTGEAGDAGEAGEAGGVVETSETGKAAEDSQAPEAAETGEIEAEPEIAEVPNVRRIICPRPHRS